MNYSKGSNNKDMWNGCQKGSTPHVQKPKYNNGLKNNTKLRPQSK